MRKEKGGKRGRKKMDDREKESEVEERVEVTEEGIERREEEEIEERPAIEEAVEEEERCEEDPECHSSAKRARVCATFTDSQEISVVEFVKQHPELYDSSKLNATPLTRSLLDICKSAVKGLYNQVPTPQLKHMISLA